MLIGAGIGAALGAFVASRTCDAGDCTWTYVKYTLVGGGVGGVIAAAIPPK